jgi:uncharacterized integral membrane protein
MIFLTIGLILGAVAVIFILQNVVPISVIFLRWEIHGSLAVILILTLLTGAILAIVSYLPEMIDSYIEVTSLKKKIQEQGAEISYYKGQIDELHKKIQ